MSTSRPSTTWLAAPGGDEPVELGAAVHLGPDSALSAQLHPDEGRVVVALGVWPTGARFDLYAQRAALVRLRDFLIDTVDALDAASADTARPDTALVSTDVSASAGPTSTTSTGHDAAA